MGREIRRVPPNWEHPKREHYGRYDYTPLIDEDFPTAFAKWLADFDRIRAGNMTKYERAAYPKGLAEWLADGYGPPDPARYRSYSDEEATWFQLYETVSEGTPVTPPFATEDELVEFLVAEGDFWSQRRSQDPNSMEYGRAPQWSREAAEQMVKRQWAPSLMVVNSEAGAAIYSAETGFPSA